jgi:hypothetical protein
MESSKTFGGFLKIYEKNEETALHFSYPLDPVLWLEAFKNLPLSFE